MTRINLVPPAELMDQHLFAEYREIRRVPSALAKSLQSKTLAQVQDKIPKVFCLGTGHVYFFYNKLPYLADRYQALCYELTARGFNFDRTASFDKDGITPSVATWQIPFVPTSTDYAVIRARLLERIAKQPTWYKHTGQISFSKQ